MQINIKIEKFQSDILNNLNLKKEYRQLYCEPTFHNFLSKFLHDSKLIYITIYNKFKLIGFIPIIYKETNFGKLANSLPFFGSHGSLISNFDFDHHVNKQIIIFLQNWMLDFDVKILTIIENPFLNNSKFWNNLSFNKRLFVIEIDSRISQVTHLPQNFNLKELENELMNSFHSKTRNMIRKSELQNFKITNNISNHDIENLHKIHFENMKKLNGNIKPLNLFKQIELFFKSNHEFSIYKSEAQNGEIAAMLLLIYSSSYVEYFTPVIAEKYRSLQPLSGLIFRGMVDSVINHKSKFWNWGGTWLNQEGVYRFKKRWGSQEKQYEYISIIQKNIHLKIKKNLSEWINENEYFFIMPE
tara:strand:- start:1342 stop:2412 length:1071 start_codon:yes stop_codon:yes gene_type:complete